MARRKRFDIKKEVRKLARERVGSVRSSKPIEPKIARMMTTCLMNVVDHGTAVRIRSFFHYPAAGKTGLSK